MFHWDITYFHDLFCGLLVSAANLPLISQALYLDSMPDNLAVTMRLAVVTFS